MIRPLCALLAASLSIALVEARQKPFEPDPPMTCDACAEWNAPQKPFKVFGNTYYVGSAGLSSVLVTGDQGHVLIDVALTQSAPLIDANIRALGFKTSDIKLILTSHAHYDHVGGVRSMQRHTGATVVSSARGVEALRLGKPTADDPQAGTGAFPAVTTNLRVAADGETLRLGSIAITAHYTPGHTPGATSWTWQSCEGARCLSVAYVDSLTAISDDGYRFSGDASHPGIVDAFRHSLDVVDNLPCDIALTTHPSASGMEKKVQAREAGAAQDPFIDAGACRALARSARAGLDARIAKEGARR
ncbi:MAG: subclass B3 metallo-beta-lactamase [Vicinamibacterales bacterium]